MEIIGHTANLSKTKNDLKLYLASNICHKIEMDFVLTKDNVLVWSHNQIVNNKNISNCYYKDVNNLLTLDDVLEILNGNWNLLLELKWISSSIDFEGLLRALEILNYLRDVSIQSFNQRFIRELLKYKQHLPFINIGLIINLFKTFIYRNGNISGLENIDFVSLSSELWEWPIVGKDYELYRNLFPDALVYAWTWESAYSESKDRIKNYINKNADGIITSSPRLVRALLK